MSTYIRQQKGRRPTDLDVKNDAARILEELLATRIDQNLRGHNKIKRNPTEQSNIKISHNSNGLDKTVLRSNTLPSNYRESTEKLNENKDFLPDQKSQNVDLSPGSSADTEDNLSLPSEKRKKKSFFKRAKERFLFTFHRNQKDRPDKVTENGKSDTTDSKTQKSEKQRENIISESNRHMKAHFGVEKSVEYIEESTYRKKGGVVHSKEHSVKPIKKSILSSFRKSKKSLNITGNKNNQRDSNGRSHHQANNIKEINTPDSQEGSSSSPQGLDIKQDSPSPYLMKQRSADEQGLKDLNADKHSGSKQSSQQLPDYQPINANISPSFGDAFLPKIPGPLENHFKVSPEDALGISNEDYALSDHRQHAEQGDRGLASLFSTQNSVLDNPGDDIEYIDQSDSESKNRDNTIHLFAHGKHLNGDESLLRKTLSPVESPENVRLTDFELDERVVSKQRPDGSTELTTTITAISRVIVPEGEEVYDELDGLFDESPVESQKSSPDREVLYSLIAQKLIDIGDSYSSSLPDSKRETQVPDAAKPLSPLEEEIIECLRSVGDMASNKAAQDTYQRFRSTMQNSLGNDLSWHQVAFLFHTTKGVITAVGRGTRSALMVKDFTLQYVSDTFASWIMDQGGFDMLLSSDESDFGVD